MPSPLLGNRYLNVVHDVVKEILSFHLKTSVL